MTDVLTISSSDLTVRIAALGAELQSITDNFGGEYMWAGDPAIWSGRAPVLFPVVGAVANGRYRHDGKTYALAKHGFARTSRFDVMRQRTDSLSFKLSDTSATRDSYPFEFDLNLEFTLVASTLSTVATVSNRGQTTMPFSFGYHPAFAWPLPGGAAKGDHLLVFESEEPAEIRRIAADRGLLAPGGEPSPVRARVLRPKAEQFTRDAMIWDRLASRRLSFGAPAGSWIDMEFPQLPHLGIWQKPGADFLAIEPWQGYNDPTDFDGDIEDKPGIVLLAPGCSRRFELRLTIRPERAPHTT